MQLALCMSLLFLIISAYKLQTKSHILFVLTVGFAFLLVFVPIVYNMVFGLKLSHLQAIKGAISNEIFFAMYAIQVACLSIVTFFISFSINSNSFGEQGGIKIERIHKNRILLRISTVISWLGLILYLYSTNNLVDFVAGNWDLIISKGRMDFYVDSSIFLVNLSYYFVSFIAVSAYLSNQGGRVDYKVFIMLLVIALVMTVISGGRKWFMLLASGYIGAYLVKHRINLKLILVAILSAVFLIFWQFLRSTKFKSGSWDVSDIFRLFINGDIIYFYYASVEAIRHFHEERLFIPFATIRTLLFLPVPSEWSFGLKVPDLSSIFGSAFMSGSPFRENNNPPGFIGIGFIGLGNFGFFILAWLGYIMYFLERHSIELVKILLYANASYLVLRLLRGSVGGFYIIVFELACLWLAMVILLLIDFLFRKKPVGH